MCFSSYFPSCQTKKDISMAKNAFLMFDINKREKERVRVNNIRPPPLPRDIEMKFIWPIWSDASKTSIEVEWRRE
jgi:hypothetical protein